MATMIAPTRDNRMRKEVWRQKAAELQRGFSNLRSHCRDLQVNIQPRRGRNLLNDNESVDEGDKRNGNIIDSTARLALRTMRSGMMSGLTSRLRPWFRFSSWDKDLAKWGPVRHWLAIAERLAYEVLERASAYDALSVNYECLGLFGTGAFGMFEDFDRVILYRPFSLGKYWFTTGKDGLPNGFYMVENPTIDQMASRFGLENMSKSARDAHDQHKVLERRKVLWVVEPNDDRMPGKYDSLNRAFRSVRFEMDEDDEKFLEESGFHELPVIISRWDTEAEDNWGRSPGMDALPDVLAVQRMYKDMLKQLQYRVNPPMGAPEELASKPSSLLPGYTNYYSAGAGMGKFEPLYQVTGTIDDIRQEIAVHDFRVRQAFYADLWNMLGDLDQQGRTVQRTAREVAERHQEKLLMLAPVLDRLITEMIRPMLLRQHMRCRRAGLLPPPPRELEQAGLKVDVVSVLAEAHQLVRAGTVERYVDYSTALAQLQPEALDLLDIDQAMRTYGDLIHIPPELLRQDVEVNDIREARAARMRAQEAAALAAEASKGAQNLANAPVGQGTMLDAVIQQQGGAQQIAQAMGLAA